MVQSDKFPRAVECLKFCFMPVVRDKLRIAAIHWNVHRIRPSTNANSPPGKPDTLYFIPLLLAQDIRDHKYAVDINVAEEVCCCDPLPDRIKSFAQLSTTIINDLRLHKPQSPEAAKVFFITLLKGNRNLRNSLSFLSYFELHSYLQSRRADCY